MSHTASNCAKSSAAGSATSRRSRTSQAVAEANDAYRQLFHLAIARDLCIEAQAGGPGSCLASIPAGRGPPRPGRIVQVFARAENGEYEQSLADVKALFKRPGCVTQAAAKSDAATASPWERPTSSA